MIYQHDFAPCLIIVTSYMDHGGISSGSFWSYIWVNFDALNAPKKCPQSATKLPGCQKKYQNVPTVVQKTSQCCQKNKRRQTGSKNNHTWLQGGGVLPAQQRYIFGGKCSAAVQVKVHFQDQRCSIQCLFSVIISTPTEEKGTRKPTEE